MEKEPTQRELEKGARKLLKLIVPDLRSNGYDDEGILEVLKEMKRLYDLRSSLH